jgi:aminoglycoside 6-adenylyltransferase
MCCRRAIACFLGCSLARVDRRVSRFLHDVAAWARAQADVRAVLIVGSQARVDTPADELSDVDLALFVDAPERYLRDASWIGSFGEPLLTFLEPTAVGGFEERRVLFRDGLEVDFSILPAAVASAPPPEAQAVLARGFAILYDGIGLAPAVAAGPTPSPPPTQEQLDQLSNDFWYHLLWTAKKLRRGEVLLAKQACDCYLTERIVQLVRWRAHGKDTWHGYRFFERWAGDQTLDALRPTFARYDAAEIGRALRVKGELFGALEHDVAQRFGLVEPVDRGEILRRLDELLTDELA